MAPARRISGWLKLAFPPPASHSPPQTLQAQALYNRHFISGWNAVTHRGVWTEWGRGAGRHRRQKPQVGVSPDPISGGLEIWRRENGHTSSPEFNTFGKRSSNRGDWGWGVPICPRHLPPSPLSSKSSLGWIQFLMSLTKRGVSISGREKGKFGPTQPASRFSFLSLLQTSSPPAYPQPPCPHNLPPSSPPHRHPSCCLPGQETPLPGYIQQHPRRGHKHSLAAPSQP